MEANLVIHNSDYSSHTSVVLCFFVSFLHQHPTTPEDPLSILVVHFYQSIRSTRVKSTATLTTTTTTTTTIVASATTMAPTVHLVRHAQGFHNICKENEVLRDPGLTDEGKTQCGELQKRFPCHAGVELIVSSPIRRTIYTSLLGFEQDIKNKGLTIVALPELQETSDLPCDTGSSPDALAKEFANDPVDLHLVHHGWNVKTGKWAPAEQAIAERARVAREWLRSRHEKEIVVVTHGSYWAFRDVQSVAIATTFSRLRAWYGCQPKIRSLIQESQAAFCTTSQTTTTTSRSSPALVGRTPNSALTTSTIQALTKHIWSRRKIRRPAGSPSRSTTLKSRS